MNKSAFIFWNVFILLIFLLLALISPSYLAPIRLESLQFHDVHIVKKDLRMPKLSFSAAGERYAILCRNHKNENGQHLCNEHFPINARDVKITLIVKDLYKNSANIALIDKLSWQNQ